MYLIDDKEIAKSFTDGGSIEIDDDEKYENLISEGGILYAINRAALDESKLEKDPIGMLTRQMVVETHLHIRV